MENLFRYLWHCTSRCLAVNQDFNKQHLAFHKGTWKEFLSKQPYRYRFISLKNVWPFSDQLFSRLGVIATENLFSYTWYCRYRCSPVDSDSDSNNQHLTLHKETQDEFVTKGKQRYVGIFVKTKNVFIYIMSYKIYLIMSSKSGIIFH